MGAAAAVRSSRERQRHWWRRVAGLPPSMQQALDTAQRQIRWGRFLALSVALAVLAALAAALGLGGMGVIAVFVGIAASRSRYFTQRITRPSVEI